MNPFESLIPFQTADNANLFESTRELLDLACPAKEDVPFFNHCMRLAKEMGMSWEEGLRYTIEQRQMSMRGR